MSKKLAAMLKNASLATDDASAPSILAPPSPIAAQAPPVVVQAAPIHPTKKPFLNAISQAATIGLHKSTVGGAQKCIACTKTVYKMEEIVAVGHIWHNSCFVCGGTGDAGGCKRVLRRENYVDHENQPYCKTCHSRLFGPRGYGSASMHNYPEDVGSGLAAPTPTPVTVPVVPPPPVPVVPVQRVVAAPAPAPAPAVVSNRGAPSGGGFHANTGAPKCTSCTKTVYKMEEMIAVGRTWHVACFVCGGTGNAGGCNRTLNRNEYVDHENQPYCKACHTKLFGPRGYGNSLSSYPDQEPVHAPVSAPETDAVVTTRSKPSLSAFLNEPEAPTHTAYASVDVPAPSSNLRHVPPPPPAASTASSSSYTAPHLKHTTAQEPVAPVTAAPAPPVLKHTPPPPPPPLPPAPMVAPPSAPAAPTPPAAPAPATNPVPPPPIRRDAATTGPVKVVVTKAGALYQEAAYSGAHDEVDEGEW